MTLNYELIVRHPEMPLTKPPLLFVHGAWHGAWCWDVHYLAYFAQRGYSAYALSLRGHGTSWGTTRYARIEDYVADVRLVMRTLPAPPVLIGHSMGGFIVQKLLALQAVPAAVLMASVPPSGALPLLIHAVLRQPLDALRALFTLDLHALLDSEAKARYWLFSAQVSDVQIRAWSARLGSESTLVLMDLLGLSLPKPAQVKTPLLVLGAAHDLLFSPDHIAATAQAYAAPYFVLPNAGHDMMLEPTWQQSADVILRWLAESGL